MLYCTRVMTSLPQKYSWRSVCAQQDSMISQTNVSYVVAEDSVGNIHGSLAYAHPQTRGQAHEVFTPTGMKETAYPLLRGFFEEVQGAPVSLSVPVNIVGDLVSTCLRMKRDQFNHVYAQYPDTLVFQNFPEADDVGIKSIKHKTLKTMKTRADEGSIVPVWLLVHPASAANTLDLATHEYRFRAEKKIPPAQTVVRVCADDVMSNEDLELVERLLTLCGGVYLVAPEEWLPSATHTRFLQLLDREKL
jgi:hypothetical protein